MTDQYLIRPDWLNLTNETAIEPARPICDPHHHLWDRPGNRYLVEDLIEDLDCGHNIVFIVFVECGAKYYADGPVAHRPVGETEFVVGEAARAATTLDNPTDVAAGIVSFVDLCLGDEVGPVLTAHTEAGGGRFRGIRHCVAADADPRVRPHRIYPRPGLLSDRVFRDGFACLQTAGVSFEAWLYHAQLSELFGLAKIFPETPIVLNHVGGPLGIGTYADNRTEVLGEWRDSILALSRCSNVVVKLGGFGMPLCGFDWQTQSRPPSSKAMADAVAPFVHHCIDCFGVERAMFESNFPVDKESCGYGVLWNAFKRVAARYPAATQDALFHDNAVKFYRLEETAPGNRC